MGIINGFVGGLGKGMADLGMLQFKDKLESEREEAEFLRTKELKKADQEFTTSERVAGEKFKSEQTDKEIQAKKDIAGMKTKDKKPPLTKYTDNEGYEQPAVIVETDDGYGYKPMLPVGVDAAAKEPPPEKSERELAAAQINKEQDNNWWFTEVGLYDDETTLRVYENRKKARAEKQGQKTKGSGTGIVGSRIPDGKPKAKPKKIIKPNKDAFDMLKKAKEKAASDPKFKQEYEFVLSQFKEHYKDYYKDNPLPSWIK